LSSTTELTEVVLVPAAAQTGSPPGRPHTPESRAKISAANKGKRPWNKGVGHSDETKARIRERTKQAMEARKRAKLAAMGLTLEEFEARKAAEAAAEKARRQEVKRNVTQSPDYKARLSQRMRERWQDPAYREKALKHLSLSRALQTNETRAKISASMKKVWEEDRLPRNRTVGEETRKKISAKLKQVYADPVYRSRLSGTRRRNPEHNLKIAEAIRKKWAEEGYKQKTLQGIQDYQAQYQESLLETPEKAPGKRRNTTAATAASVRVRAARSAAGGRPGPKRLSAAKRKAIAREELQELERMDREMRGEIKPRKSKGVLKGSLGRRKSNEASELLVKQAKDVWTQMYGEGEEGGGEGEAGVEDLLLQVIRQGAKEGSEGGSSDGGGGGGGEGGTVGEGLEAPLVAKDGSGGSGEGQQGAGASGALSPVIGGGEASIAAGPEVSVVGETPGREGGAPGVGAGQEEGGMEGGGMEGEGGQRQEEEGEGGQRQEEEGEEEAGTGQAWEGEGVRKAVEGGDEESDLEWRKIMERMAKNDLEDAELKKQRKAAQKRFLEEEVATDVFRLVDGKVAVLPTPLAAPGGEPLVPPPPPPPPSSPASHPTAASAGLGPSQADDGEGGVQGAPGSAPPPASPLLSSSPPSEEAAPEEGVESFPFPSFLDLESAYPLLDNARPAADKPGATPRTSTPAPSVGGGNASSQSRRASSVGAKA
jgi:hypothetical protein